jgi:hypothetical protein
MGFSPSSFDKQQEAKRAQFPRARPVGLIKQTGIVFTPSQQAVSNVYRVEHGQGWRPLARYADLLGAI